MAHIRNMRTGKTLAGSFDIAGSFSARARGLMFRHAIEKPLLFVFDGGYEKCRAECAIHSLFVFFPFSAIFLDAERRVVDVRVAQPFVSFIVPSKASAYLIEGSPGLADEVKVGDVLEF